MSLADIAIARLLSGRPYPLLGRLLSEQREDGPAVLLDPETGNELQEGAAPAFILSTEHEATDSCILRQHWNLSRNDDAGPGIPVLWNHSPDTLLGRWRDLKVQEMPGVGPALIGRADLDLELPEAALRRRQIRAGYLSAVSVRWRPGKTVRRGDLPQSDPLYREPREDMCDEPAEGFVMGTPEQPNELIECSLTPIPADARAAATERTLARAAHDLDSALRGAPADWARTTTLLGADPRVRSWARALIWEQLRSEEGRAFLSELFRSLPADPLDRPLSFVKGG